MERRVISLSMDGYSPISFVLEEGITETASRSATQLYDGIEITNPLGDFQISFTSIINNIDEVNLVKNYIKENESGKSFSCVYKVIMPGKATDTRIFNKGVFMSHKYFTDRDNGGVHRFEFTLSLNQEQGRYYGTTGII